MDNVERIAQAFGVEAHQLFLFSLGDVLKSEEEVTEDKVKDLLERCGTSKKGLVLRVVADIARWDG